MDNCFTTLMDALEDAADQFKSDVNACSTNECIANAAKKFNDAVTAAGEAFSACARNCKGLPSS
jgi:hypothetical protein